MQVSIWAGTTMPNSRPEGCCSARSIRPSASAIAFSPAASSHSYSTRWPFLVNHRARAEHRRDAHPHAALGQQVEPAGMRHRQVGDRGDARQQQLAERHADAVRHRLRIGAEDRQVFVERGVIQARAADLVDQALVHRLAAGVAVDVDQPRHRPSCRRRRTSVSASAGIVAADEGDGAALEGDVGAGHVDVPLAPHPRRRPCPRCG